jgi:hypothetical protein
LAGVSELIDPSFGAREPAVDIVKQYLAGIRTPFAQLSDTSWTARERGRTGQRLLPVSRHDGRSRAAAVDGIAAAALMFGNQP